MNRNGLIIVGIGAAALLAGSSYFISPYMAAANLKSAIKAGDREAIAERIDFPEVRDNLKSQLNAAILKKISSDPSMKNNPFAGLGAMFAPVIIGKLLDAYVTADSFANLAKTNSNSGGASNSPFSKAAKGEYQARYLTLDRFEVSARGDENDTISFEMHRSGFWTWRVERINLPLDTLTAPTTATTDGTSSGKLATAATSPDQPAQPPADASENITTAPQNASFAEEPPFASYPAGPIFSGTPTYPDYSGRDQSARMYRTMIRNGIAQGPKFAGSYALVQFGCGTDCTTGYVVNLRSGQVINLPAGGENDPDMQIIAQPNSRLMAVITQDGGVGQAESRCIRRLFLFDDEEFSPLPGKEVAPGTCPTLAS